MTSEALNQGAESNVFSNRQNSLYDMSASFRCDGRLFHSLGPAAPNALSQYGLQLSLACHLTNSVVALKDGV